MQPQAQRRGKFKVREGEGGILSSESSSRRHYSISARAIKRDRPVAVPSRTDPSCDSERVCVCVYVYYTAFSSEARAVPYLLQGVRSF